MHEEIIIAGSGGQGIMFLGNLLCWAAVSQNKYTTFYPSYGAEIRGGTANCSVVISDNEIGSPVISNPSTLIILNEVSYNKFMPKLKKGGNLFLNTTLMETVPGNVISVPASEIASQSGDIRIANMVMLGKFIAVTKMFSIDIIKSVIEEVFKNKKGLININITAFIKGMEL
ncbi:MAG: hypothetical protein A2474_06775 [Elusimicrobia bacterium RIFOXYC2_FULL_34_12]|nr:MAG: hypothetical protein A2474_06775 [Elusimicrobia bacterium RIFOXYC2_FULL_34_12]